MTFSLHLIHSGAYCSRAYLDKYNTIITIKYYNTIEYNIIDSISKLNDNTSFALKSQINSDCCFSFSPNPV